jgi:hypothetical protein
MTMNCWGISGYWRKEDAEAGRHPWTTGRAISTESDNKGLLLHSNPSFKLTQLFFFLLTPSILLKSGEGPGHTLNRSSVQRISGGHEEFR